MHHCKDTEIARFCSKNACFSLHTVFPTSYYPHGTYSMIPDLFFAVYFVPLKEHRWLLLIPYCIWCLKDGFYSRKNKHITLSWEHNSLTNRIQDLPLHGVYLYQITGAKLKSDFANLISISQIILRPLMSQKIEGARIPLHNRQRIVPPPLIKITI